MDAWANFLLKKNRGRNYQASIIIIKNYLMKKNIRVVLEKDLEKKGI
jgi:hypothetical protein